MYERGRFARETRVGELFLETMNDQGWINEYTFTISNNLQRSLIWQPHPPQGWYVLYIFFIFVFFEPDLRSQAHSQQALLLSLRQLPFANDINLMITILLESLVLENKTFPM